MNSDYFQLVMQYKHEPLDSHLSLSLLNSVHNKKNMVKWAKKEILKITILVLNQSPISAVFPIVLGTKKLH